MLINKLTLHIYVLLLVTFFPVNGWGEIYKWVDKHGQTHFSDKRNAADNNAVKERGALSEQDSKARSDLLNSEIGVVLLKQVNHGKYYQYMPEGALSNFRIVVVNHGMFSEGETAEASAAATLKAWKRFANKHKITLIAHSV
ncbi:MAG: DUF4124 domain-containing protein [Oceanospirillaceae bacterium]|nr:DUF4124 domain-containing protein [Oceanospirillaceae bacterium]